ncbi:BTAD domain-containing putative transcriptional regulator [Gordonia sp. CPCC 205515]|uniref:BTAD domain-containing putative transcriptional regulator n=1 Tax=Gordonia sp. CPCC 205515 TaxID=3140791 RepID=UPI003AF3FE8D
MISVLGGLRVVNAPAVAAPDGGAPLRLERKARELLTLLAVHAPSVMSVPELTRVLWDEPPESAPKTLRAHVSRIRAALRAAGTGDTVVTVGTGYRLVADLDLDHVRELRRRARTLVSTRPDAAVETLAAAREFWRGDPELPGTIAGQAMLVGWQREHAQLVREHLGAMAAGSDPGAALGELAGLTAADPADESAWVDYVVALHRSGRHAEALETVARARHALGEVGLDPGPALRAAQARVLEPESVAPTAHIDDSPPQYTPDGRTAFLTVSTSGPDTILLNPGLLTIDGLLDEPHVNRAHRRLGSRARLVCLDRRGIGLSEPLDHSSSPLDQWVDDLTRVVAAAAMTRPVIVANFDTGLIALECAARQPTMFSGLVLINCFARYRRGDGYPHGLDASTARDLVEDAVDTNRPHGIGTAALVAPNLAGDPDFRSWWDRIGRRGAGPGTARQIRTAATTTDLRPRLPEVTVPVLLLSRRSCTNVDPGHSRYLAEHLPNATLRLAAGADAVWFSGSDDIVDHTIDFIHSVTTTHR